MRTTTGIRTRPWERKCSLASWETIWSKPGKTNPSNWISHTGRKPRMRQPDGGADDARLGQRGVQHPLLAEVLLQAVGDPEDAAELADVLAHHEDLGVALHRRAQARR